MKHSALRAVAVSAISLIALAGSMAVNAQGTAPTALDSQPNAGITLVLTSTLAAISEVPANAKVEDFEAAILFALDKIQQPFDVMDRGLLQAYDQTPEGPARTAIANIRAMKLRLAGTGSVPAGSAFGGLALGPSLGGGGGGSGNYGS